MKKIIGVAVKYNESDFFVSLPEPNRHHHIIRMMVEEGFEEPPIIGEQGFVDTMHNFLTREESYDIAIENGQFNRRDKRITSKKLFSEDLW